IFYDLSTEIFGITFGDITTGEVYSTTLDNTSLLLDELMKFSPKEIIVNEDFNFEEIITPIQNDFLVTTKKLDFFTDSKIPKSIDKIKNLKDYQINSIAGFYNYIFETQKINLSNIKQIEFYNV